MLANRSIKWEEKRRWYFVEVLVVAIVAALLTPMTSSAEDAPLLQVIVEKATGGDGSLEQLVENLGGSVLLDLLIIHGFSAEVPQSAVSVSWSASIWSGVSWDGARPDFI